MNIGRPKRVIEVEPTSLPLPEVVPAPAPEPAPVDPVPVEPGR